MKTVYRARCKTCGESLRDTEDPYERDWLMVWHSRRYGHQYFRRWTEDQLDLQERP